MHLSIGIDVLAALHAHAQRALPAECCGLLLGRRRAVTHVVTARNRLDNADRLRGFYIGPTDLLRAEKAARHTGLLVLGSYHSHPHNDARPSLHDLAHAVPGWSHLIVGCLRGRTRGVRSWRLQRHRKGFVEERLSVQPPAGYEFVAEREQERHDDGR